MNEGLCKLMLNSLYGKFGQKTPKWEPRPNMIAPEPYCMFFNYKPLTGEAVKFHAIGDYVFEKVPQEEHANAFPAIASFVTAYAREHMKWLRQVAGNHNVYYQATDSVMVNEDGYERLLQKGVCHDEELGKLKLECEAEGAIIYGINHYQIGDKLVEGGKKSNATTHEDGSWTELQFESLNRVLQRRPTNGVLIREVSKARTGIYTKGVPQEDGSVEPFRYVDNVCINAKEG